MGQVRREGERREGEPPGEPHFERRLGRSLALPYSSLSTRIGHAPQVTTMSTVKRAKRTTLPPLEAGQRLDQPTFHERYEAMPPSTRAELVGGVVYMPSPMRYEHGDIGGDVAVWAGLYNRSTKGLRGGNDSTVILDEIGETQPDGASADT